VRIVIDLGHGGPDRGNVHNGIEEADLVESVGFNLVAHLTLAGHEVTVTRDQTRDPTPGERDRVAREFDAAFVLSIHADAQPHGGTDWRGSTSFYWRSNHRTGLVASDIAETMPRQLKKSAMGRVHGLAADDTSYPRAVNVVAPFTPPTVLVELGYLTNARDAEYLGTALAADRIVAALFAGCTRAAELYGG